MLVGQAFVRSNDSRITRFNEVISRSVNIDDQVARTLCEWSPTFNDMPVNQTQSVNCFRVDKSRIALSRSVVGTLENSYGARRNIFNHVVVLDRKRLGSYHNNLALVAKVLRSMGSLILPTTIPEKLPLLRIPENSFQGQSLVEQSNDTERVAHAIEIHRQVVILGLADPVSYLVQFLSEMPIEKRLDITFATGQKVAEKRLFSLQFFKDSHPALMKELASRQLRTISMESASAAP